MKQLVQSVIAFTLIFLQLAVVPYYAMAQTVTYTPYPVATPTPVPGTVTGTSNPSGIATPIPTPEPYTKEEFPQWVLDMRRFDIITIGAFPFAYLFSNMIFDISRYTYKYATGATDASLYTPLFFAPPNKPTNTTEENIVILIASSVVSLGIALVDFILGKVEASKSIQQVPIGPPIILPTVAPQPSPSPSVAP